MRKPKGHVRPHGTGYQVIVPVGLDPITKRYRYAYRQAATLEEAEELRDKLLADLAKGRQPRKEATFGQLLDAALEVAQLAGRQHPGPVPGARRGGPPASARRLWGWLPGAA